jgi:uncharacterized membrane protein YidH (DUF202 family)
MSSDSVGHRWRLSLALLAGPLLALVFQALAYADVPWACNGGSATALHVLAAIFVVVTIAVLVDAFAMWRRSGRGAETDRATAADRSRFLALTGMLVSGASLLLVIAMWVPVFVFDPCAR